MPLNLENTSPSSPPVVGEVIRGRRNAPWAQGRLLSEPSRVTNVTGHDDGTWTIAYTTINAPYASNVRATREQLGAVEFLPSDTTPKPRATGELELIALEDYEREFCNWADAEGVLATDGAYMAWAGWNDLGITERGLLVGAPW